MVDYAKFPIDIDIEKVKNGVTQLTVVGDVAESKSEFGNRYVLTGTANDKKRYRVSFFEREYAVFADFMRTHGLSEENGVRLTLAVKQYTKRDKTQGEKIIISRVDSPETQNQLS